MVEEVGHTTLTNTGEKLAKVDEFTNDGEWVVVGSLCRSGPAQDAGKEGGEIGSLVGHTLGETPVLRIQTGGLEVLD